MYDLFFDVFSPSPSSPSKFAFQQIPYLLQFKIHKVLCAAGRQGPAASGAEEIGSNEAGGGPLMVDDTLLSLAP